MSAARIIVAVVAERYTLCAQCMGCWMLGKGMKREASTFMLSWWQRGGAMLMAVPRQWQQRFVVVLGKLTMDVSRGFGGKFTRMCFGSGISSSTSGTAKGSIYLAFFILQIENNLS